uniref:Uncharacterized protein n=1 Tax=viral metagenome TaxID=1070528 RepID=A0A6C0DKU9_9ZZZZ
MKFYETSYEEYINSVEKYNLHKELIPICNSFPKMINKLENLIIYGPSGAGKYSQVLNIIKKYSLSDLKYDRKIIANTEKQQYIYKISDIHYEIDMSLLGCNSKILWHEIFFQIVDIISVKKEKYGIILCKNFHLIHNELLDIFYSYMQQYNHSQSNIKIKFFIITEHISFLPTPIINNCHVLRIGRPNKETIEEMLYSNYCLLNNKEEQRNFTQRITDYKIMPFNLLQRTNSNIKTNIIKTITNNIELEGVMNIKEFRSFPLILEDVADIANIDNNNVDISKDLPKDVFNIICDNIIKEISEPTKISFTGFRDILYDILTYNLDMTECLWYILQHFIDNNYITKNDISEILIDTFLFLKYYNNNYRPIYHLERIMFTIINKIHNF